MDKRTQITEAALRLFIENGFHNTSTANISKAAGVATGTLFIYFRTKEDLIHTLYKEAKQELGAFLATGFPAKENTKNKLKHLWDKANDWAHKHNDAFRFMNMYKSSPLITKLSHEELAPSGDFAIASVKDGVKKGEIIDIDLELLFAIIEGLLTATVTQSMAKPRSRKQIINDAFEVFWQGVGKKKR